jgi:lactate permease
VPALLAALPLAVVLVAMGALRWSAVRAGGAGLAAAALLAAAVFGLAPEAELPASAAASGIGAEALNATATILWIILPALALYEFQRRTGAFDRIRTALLGLTADRRLHAILVAWFFGLLMEGAAGFGTPVALAAPLLVGIGFAPPSSSRCSATQRGCLSARPGRGGRATCLGPSSQLCDGSRQWRSRSP